MTTRIDAPRILVLFGNVPLHGQERANIEALDALRTTGCEVLFLIRAEWTKDTIQRELNRRGLAFVAVPYFDAVRRGVSPRVWFNNMKGVAGGSWQLLRLIRELRATHVHVGSVSNVLNFLPALSVTALPLVFRAGDVPPSHHGLWRLVWQFTRRRASHFVCDSKFIQEKLVSLGVSPASTSVIYSPAPTRATPPRLPNETRGAEPLTFLYVGQITREKGVHLFVDAAIRLSGESRQVRFLIAGDYEWNNPFARSLIADVAAVGLADRIEFTGFVEDIDALYRRAHVHVCPSLWDEPYGLTVMEAKERALPSVVFPSGGLVELVRHLSDGYVCSESTASGLLGAFELYCRDPDLARRHGEAAKQSLERFSLHRFAEMWRSVYDRVQLAG